MGFGMHGNLGVEYDGDTRIGDVDGEVWACRDKTPASVQGGEGTSAAAGEVNEKRHSPGLLEVVKNEWAERRKGGERTAPDEDRSQPKQRPSSPRSRRVGIVFSPQNYKRPHSLLDLKDAARICGNCSLSSNDICNSSPTPTIANPPVIPPRSPLRPISLRYQELQDPSNTTPAPTPASQLINLDVPLDTDARGHQMDTVQSLRTSKEMLRRHSLGSLTAILDSLAADPTTFHDKELPLPPDYDDDLSRTTQSDSDEDDSDPDVDPDSPSEVLAQELGVSVSPTPPADAVTLNSGQHTVMTKRMHALFELLSSERAYASDLALIRDIHIPLALGQPPPFSPTGSGSPPLFPSGSGSGSSSRTVSTASDSSTSSSQLGPPMSREDVRHIFGNIEDLAVFADRFVGLLEKAIGGAIENGNSDDRVGTLFLEIIPSLEPPYKTYITRHPTALAHLNSLPPSPALSAYLSQTRTLASSLTHAWDLPSLLIKPVQRLLKYSLLLGAIIDATPDNHGDRAALVEAKQKMEDVARSVNEERRRWEVVREVLGDSAFQNTNGKSKKGSNGVSVGMVMTGTAHLGRMKTLRPSKTKEMAETGIDNAEAVEVARLESELQRYAAFFDRLARDVREWRDAMEVSLFALRQWGIAFGAVLGLTPSPSALNPDLIPDSPSGQAIDTSDPEVRSEAYDAFTSLLSSLPPLCDVFDERLRERFIPVLCELKAMLEPPKKLLSAMHALTPLHAALLHTPFSPSKGRRPAQALLTASQSYLALRSALAAELPLLLSALKRATALAVRILADEQANLYVMIADRWAELWDALRVDGERCGGSEETLRVWWERWSEVEERLPKLKITRREKWWAERERELKEGRDFRSEARDKSRDANRERQARKAGVPASGSSATGFDSQTVTVQSSPNSQARRQHHSHVSNSTPTSDKRRSGSSAVTPPPPQVIQRRPSDESFRSGKSGKSSGYGGRSGRNSRVDDEPPVPRLKPNFVASYSNGPQHRKSAPTIAPLRTSASSTSQTLVDVDAGYPPSPLSRDVFDDDEQDRGRSQRRPSFKSKITDPFKPAHHRRRSSSVKSLGAPSSLTAYSMDIPLPSYSPSAQFAHHAIHSTSTPTSRPRASPTLATTRALYTTRVIHACEPPPGVSYRGLPFFTLEYGDMYDVLREYGHPSTHADLPLYVDDGEDCLLLVRERAKGNGNSEGSEVGWALASFLVPVD
ncbi:hypothetical protein BKA82DRAFT_995591 [Pisolithus tinctorius]|uniref:DH domain-containing protein n=1 Tax=Pisolithus tinctorius Marx 270 TaxID=870435 RepID=A0A0C3PNH5_PISTI|nr:hypothetical protein BKA82DRAFT_995591 [Pisolithus tinctorius]KIO10406.1 hypothetical protein M404DRAFT_995591 [Pisolithus tinctorius Marx 270]